LLLPLLLLPLLQSINPSIVASVLRRLDRATEQSIAIDIFVRLRLRRVALGTSRSS
jgi:hypothetical protein